MKNLSAATAFIAVVSAASPAAVFASSKTGKHTKPKTSKTSTKAAKHAKSFVKPSLSYGGGGGSYSMSVDTATPSESSYPSASPISLYCVLASKHFAGSWCQSSSVSIEFYQDFNEGQQVGVDNDAGGNIFLVNCTRDTEIYTKIYTNTSESSAAFKYKNRDDTLSYYPNYPSTPPIIFTYTRAPCDDDTS